METMVVATRTLAWQPEPKRGGTDEIRIMRLLLLHAMKSRELWTFRGLDSCFDRTWMCPRQMEKCVRYSEWTFLA